MINNQLCGSLEFYGEETISFNVKSVKKVKPNFSDDDTAVGRLLFAMIGLLAPMMKILDSANEDSGTLIVCNNLKLRGEQQECECCCEVKFSGAENLVVALLDVLYNFYEDVEKWTPSEQKNIVIVLRTNGKMMAFELEGGRYNQAMNRGQELIKTSRNFKNEWEKIYLDIIDNLYLNDLEEKEIKEGFKNLMASYENLNRDISKKYLKSDEIYFYNGFGQESICATFPCRIMVECYLKDYYEIAKLCIKYYRLFMQSPYAQNIVERILNFGISNNKQGDVNLLKSPFALDVLLHIYNRSIAFVNEINKTDDSKGLKAMLESDFVSSCIIEFRRWVYSSEKCMLTTFEGQENALKSYKCSNLSSIFMVRAIRLFEKIKAYLKQTKKYDSRICIVGYTRIEGGEAPEIEELKKMVKLACEDEPVNITYNVYMNGQQRTVIDKKDIKVHKEKYSELFQRQSIEKVINENDLIFFLDAPSMYYEDFYPRMGESWGSAYMSLKDNSYAEDSQRHEVRCAIGTVGVMTEISKHLVAMSNPYSTNSGSFEPFLKEYLLEYISKCVKLSNTRKTVYCYLSTIETRDGTNYKRSKLSHMEKYNGKEFYILKFDNLGCESTSRLQLYSKDKKEYFPDMIMKPICFSFWNILKNVSIRLKETVFEVENAPYLLDNIGIELSWDSKMEKFKIRFGATEDVIKSFEEKGVLFCDNGKELKNILEEIFKIVLGNRESMMQKSIRDDVANVLLGRAEDAIHYLYYYRVQKADLKVKSIECEMIKNKEGGKDDADKKIKEILGNNFISRKSDKKLYIEMMRIFDLFSVDEMQRILLKNQILENGEDPELIYQNILDACRECKYTDCNLYYNMEG